MKGLKRIPSKLAISIASVLVAVCIVYLAISYLTKPAVGLVNNNFQATTSQQAPVTSVRTSGKYVSFDYPSIFSITAAPSPSGKILETFAYTKKPFPFWFLNAEVLSLPSGKITDDGSYMMRSEQPGQYKLSTLVIKGSEVNVFSDTTSPYAKVAFVAHGQYLFTLSLNSSDVNNTQTLDQVFSDALKSLEWQK